MLEEADPQTLRDCRSETMRMVLGGKVLQCKVCSDKYGSDPISEVSTIDVSNMVLKALKNKCDEIHHPDTNDGAHQSKDDIIFV
jgi:hypothetical protein